MGKGLSSGLGNQTSTQVKGEDALLYCVQVFNTLYLCSAEGLSSSETCSCCCCFHIPVLVLLEVQMGRSLWNLILWILMCHCLGWSISVFVLIPEDWHLQVEQLVSYCDNDWSLGVKLTFFFWFVWCFDSLYMWWNWWKNGWLGCEDNVRSLWQWW